MGLGGGGDVRRRGNLIPNGGGLIEMDGRFQKDKLKDRGTAHLLSATCNLRISQRSLGWQRPRARGLGAPNVNKRRNKKSSLLAKDKIK